MNATARNFLILGLIVLLPISHLVCVFVGIEIADSAFKADLDDLSRAYVRLEQDLATGAFPDDDRTQYYLDLCPSLPLEHPAAESVTYYVGFGARHSFTFEFSESGVERFHLNGPSVKQ